MLWPSSKGRRKRKEGGKHKKNWQNNIKERTSLNFYETQVATTDRQRWKQIVRLSSQVPQMSGHRRTDPRFSRESSTNGHQSDGLAI